VSVGPGHISDRDENEELEEQTHRIDAVAKHVFSGTVYVCCSASAAEVQMRYRVLNSCLLTCRCRFARAPSGRPKGEKMASERAN
jgi:hypothetical protein